jgi:hypothetical protein
MTRVHDDPVLPYLFSKSENTANVTPRHSQIVAASSW